VLMLVGTEIASAVLDSFEFFLVMVVVILNGFSVKYIDDD
jgi:hypothetical protein